MKYKPGVEHDKLHPELVEVFPVVELTYGKVLSECGMLPMEMTMTSGHEGDPSHGPHNKKSRHYIVNCPSGYGEAADFRMNDINQTLATEVCGEIAKQLRVHFPNKFKVFFEGCLKTSAHLHIQIR